MNRILFLSRWLPYPPNNGSKLRIYNLLRGLKQEFEISLITFIDQKEKDTDLSHLRQICSDVDTVTWKSYQPTSMGALSGLLTAEPRFLVDTFSEEIVQKIEERVTNGNIALVIASQIDMAIYRNFFPDIPALFEEVELATHYERYARARSLVRRARHLFTWKKHQRYIGNLLNSYDACTVVSEPEFSLLKQAVPEYDSVELVPNCVDLSSYEDVLPAADINHMIFTGSFTYGVNYEAMVWFSEEVLPLVREEIPDATLKITGDHANLRLPEANSVNFTGFVDDVRPLVAGSRVSIVPIRVGGGTRLKILEAMALRTPVVTTSKGAEGLDVQHMVHLMVADTADGFADAIIRLIQDPNLHERLATNAYKLVHDTYNWKLVMPRVRALAESLIQQQ